MNVTDTLSVTIVSQSANQITFRITNPVLPLLLGTLRIDALPAGANGVIGTLSPVGVSVSNPSVHNFHVGSLKFSQFLASVNAHPGPPLSIQITYDNVTLAATDVRVTAMQMAANG